MFIVSETTMAARVTLPKKKILAARITYWVPPAEELPDRLDTVLTVIYLLYTTGHTAPSGGQLVRADLVEAALHLARMLMELMPDEREVQGLLASMLVIDARRHTHTNVEGGCCCWRSRTDLRRGHRDPQLASIYRHLSSGTCRAASRSRSS
jgi:RNA polymerase sigma-70 factor (ECF subfamily)